MAQQKKGFFAQAFQDMKENARAQHAVDKAVFEAIKAESRANFAEAKAAPKVQAQKRQAEREAAIAEALKRKADAEARIQAARNPGQK
ncbi:MAG TPA: hypothetical protein IAC31_05780 [Candidatus Faecousia intestinigallinarum]|nr:hypothetical protein [Candidatus Faecousia intestinigallinarum]